MENFHPEQGISSKSLSRRGKMINISHDKLDVTKIKDSDLIVKLKVVGNTTICDKSNNTKTENVEDCTLSYKR